MDLKLYIPRRGQHCSAGNEQLSVGATYYSILEEGSSEPSSNLVRKDYCVECWAKSSFPKNRFWKSVVLPKKREAPPPDMSTYAIQLLKEALASENTEEEAFVLALYLARKKELFLRDEMVRENGERFFLYEVAATEEMLAVKKLELSQSRAEKIQANLSKKFQEWKLI